MKFTWQAYIAITVVCALSLCAAAFLPVSDLAEAVIASPAAVALFAALYQLMRDEAKFQKAKILKEEERLHALSISSHMAVVAFDKHAEFSEKYLKEIRVSMPILFREGPTTEALDFAERLRDIRLDYSAWVATETKEALWPFEKALRTVGINKYILKDTPIGDRRNRLVDEAHELFAKILEMKNEEDTAEEGVSKAVSKIQGLLGVNELTKLRRNVLREANKSLLTTATSAE